MSHRYANSLYDLARYRLSAFFAALLGVLLISGTGPANAMKIQEVVSPGGIKAWLVEERGIPLVTMQFAFEGGSTQDPEDKPGVAHLISALLDEGAGKLSSAEFQARAEELAIKLSYTAGRDYFYGSFQALSENLPESIELLRLSLNEPRFDADAVERMRRQIAAGLKFDAKNPSRVASKAWYQLAFAGHPYARPVKGSVESLSAMGAEDLRDFKRRVFARDKLTVAVVGDIDAATLGRLLDTVFGKLPAKGDLSPVSPVDLPKSADPKIVEMNVPQSTVQFGNGAIDRKDKDYYAAYVLNHILGGGGFSSRLMEEVREKRGLAYGVYSYLYPLKHASLFIGGVATQNARVKESIDVIRGEIKRLAEEGPGKEDLENSKRYLTGSYALRFDTSPKIAQQLLGIQQLGLGIDYVDRRNQLIETVTLEDVRRVAKRFLKPDGLIITIVGKPKGQT